MKKMELAGGPPVQKGMARGAVWAGVTTALMAVSLLVVHEMTQITNLEEALRAAAHELDDCTQKIAPSPVASQQEPGVTFVNGTLSPQAVLPSPAPPPLPLTKSGAKTPTHGSKDDIGCTRSPSVNTNAWTETDRQDAIACLSNKTIWFLGNSVSRHWAFTLADILAEKQSSAQKMKPIMYENQKQKCGRGGAWKGKRPDGGIVPGSKDCWGLCECSFNSVQRPSALGSGANLVFGWIWSLASTDVEQNLLKGLGTSPPPDIVVYNAGLPDAACPPCHAGLDEAQVQAPELAKMVERVLQARPELHFYWRSTTALCRDRERLNGQVRTLNTHIEAYLCAVPEVRKLDGFAWTEGRCADFDDNIHHSLLAFSHVTSFLRYECPRIGKT